VEAVDEDHRFALATLFAGKRTRKIVAEGARFRIVDLFRGDEVGQRVWLAPRRGEANLARLAIRRDRDVDPREPRDLAPRPAVFHCRPGHLAARRADEHRLDGADRGRRRVDPDLAPRLAGREAEEDRRYADGP